MLVVDDHPLARSGMSALLGSEGIMVMAEAKSGEEALECFRTSHPDIAVIDVNLPGIDGWETTQTLTDEFPAAPVILTSNVWGCLRPAKSRGSGSARIPKEGSTPRRPRHHPINLRFVMAGASTRLKQPLEQLVHRQRAPLDLSIRVFRPRNHKGYFDHGGQDDMGVHGDHRGGDAA